LEGIQGVQGVAGADGAVWKGPWVPGDTYVARDIVEYNGSSYVALSATSGFIAPSLAVGTWQLVAAKGTDGTATVLAGDVTGAPGANTISNGAVNNLKLANDAVDTDKILNGSVSLLDLSFVPALASDITALYTVDNAVNDGDGKVQWTNLDNVPTTIVNGIASDIACTTCITGGDIADNTIPETKLNFNPATQAELDALKTPDNAANDSDGKVDWTNIDSVPAGIVNRVGLDLTCTTCVETSDLAAGAVTEAKLSFDPATQGELNIAMGALLAPDPSGAPAVNDGDGFVNWTNLEAVPAEIVNRTAADVVCNPAPCVDESDMRNDSVGGGQVKLDSLGSDDLGPASVGESEIVTDAVRTAEIKDGEVGYPDINPSIWGSNFNRSGTSLPAAAGSTAGELFVDTDEFGGTLYRFNGVTWVKIARGVTEGAASLGPDSVTTNEIALDTIKAEDIENGAVTTNEIALDTIKAEDIENGAVTTNEIYDGTINHNDIGVLTGKIVFMPTNASDEIIVGKSSAVNTTFHIFRDGGMEWLNGAFARFRIAPSGQLEWGDGTVAPDVWLGRVANDQMHLDGKLDLGGDLSCTDPTGCVDHPDLEMVPGAELERGPMGFFAAGTTTSQEIAFPGNNDPYSPSMYQAPGRIQIPANGKGRYLINASAEFDATNTGWPIKYKIELTKNGGQVLAVSEEVAYDANRRQVYLDLNEQERLNPGDSIGLFMVVTIPAGQQVQLTSADLSATFVSNLTP
jgi:hypothetical protein